MQLRIGLACGQWRVIECDGWSLDGALTRFVRDGKTVLFAPTNFLALIEPLPQAPEASGSYRVLRDRWLEDSFPSRNSR